MLCLISKISHGCLLPVFVIILMRISKKADCAGTYYYFTFLYVLFSSGCSLCKFAENFTLYQFDKSLFFRKYGFDRAKKRPICTREFAEFSCCGKLFLMFRPEGSLHKLRSPSCISSLNRINEYANFSLGKEATLQNTMLGLFFFLSVYLFSDNMLTIELIPILAL